MPWELPESAGGAGAVNQMHSGNHRRERARTRNRKRVRKACKENLQRVLEEARTGNHRRAREEARARNRKRARQNYIFKCLISA